MYSDTVTLFNRHRGETSVVWYPTILYGVDLNVDKAAIVAKYGEQSTDNAVLHVRYSEADGVQTVAGKLYFPPKEWQRLEPTELPESITFASGQEFDFFAAGAWADVGPISDMDYTDGFYNYVNTRYDFAFAITSVARYSVIPHFEIMAR